MNRSRLYVLLGILLIAVVAFGAVGYSFLREPAAPSAPISSVPLDEEEAPDVTIVPPTAPPDEAAPTEAAAEATPEEEAPTAEAAAEEAEKNLLAAVAVAAEGPGERPVICDILTSPASALG